VVRLALILALSINSRQIKPEHLYAARALTDYVMDSLDYILSRDWWGDAGNPHDPAGMAPRVLQTVEDGPKLRSHIMHGVFHRNRTAREINAVRDLLIQQQRIKVERTDDGETWSKC